MILIPAYEPPPGLVRFVQSLLGAGSEAVVVVNDGSSARQAPVFAELRGMAGVEVVEHAVNLGKGAALKTGMNHALVTFPECVGVVTADADGQHAVADVLKVAARLKRDPRSLILGARDFSGAAIPARSRFGNSLTRLAVKLFVGETLSDTQTGLRGVPRELARRLLRIPTTGYEFELDMLITARHDGIRIAEERIATIYLEGNRSSHFNPLLDSMRIYFVLLRFLSVSVLTAVIDNLVFLIAYRMSNTLLAAQLVGRIAAVMFNYSAARKSVFQASVDHGRTFPRYMLLIVAGTTFSYFTIRALTSGPGMPVLTAKLIAEGLFFVANFLIQRDLVFVKKRED